MKHGPWIIAALFVSCLTIEGTGCRKKSTPPEKPQAGATVSGSTAQARPMPGPRAESEALPGVAAYPGSVRDEEKCGPGSLYVEGVSAERVSREYCELLKQAGWRLMGPSRESNECPALANGSMTFRARRAMIVDFWKYGETRTCYHARFVR